MKQSNTTVYWYIYNHRYTGYMFRLLSSHLQALKEYRSNQQGSQVHCGVPNRCKIVTVTIWNHMYYMIVDCYSNYFVIIGDPTVHLTALLIGSVFFEGLKMTR